ncbi:winged helix-turn-helix domain-containing protein [Amycolatopsis sp. NPDC058986]|uniref:winged helix-turn-helix domain-containing protein n=1 Tax=unclassified Amycolatopsis TaxID=2618356 RepID=UPI00366EC702
MTRAMPRARVELTFAIRVDADHERAAGIAARVATAVQNAVGDCPEPGEVLLFEVPPPTVRPTVERPLRLHVPSRRALLHGEALDFTRLEFDLLLYLATHPDRVLDRETLLREVWELPGTVGGRTVDVHVRKIRGKLEPVIAPITTVRGVGYRFDGADQVDVELADAGHRPLATVTAVG